MEFIFCILVKIGFLTLLKLPKLKKEIKESEFPRYQKKEKPYRKRKGTVPHTPPEPNKILRTRSKLAKRKVKKGPLVDEEKDPFNKQNVWRLMCKGLSDLSAYTF